ncbi:substrate-binding periplasmic protein [Hahella ganghwensis]|uniref:substrate-binding periplasmic protein n=1 Tax=Hahella ganghwensis TaxID=286420 RepID=UPI000381B48C|nr:transporter substrate-binding domain-containing protein [Hahella ganghwensis]
MARLLLFVIVLLIPPELLARDLLIAGPPWTPFLDPEHPRKGVATEIVVTCLERAGYPTKVVIKPWPRVLAEAGRGDIDALVGLWFSADRAELFHYSKPYYVNEIYLFRQRERLITTASLQSLQGISIGVRQNARYGSEFDKADFLQKVELNELINILRMVSVGRLDAGVGDRLIVQSLLQTEPGLRGKLVFSEPALSRMPLHMAVSRRNSEHRTIVSRFNAALREMLQDGTLANIYRSWDISQSPGLAFQYSSEE